MAIGLELDLPSAEEQERLLDGLARLIGQQGYEKFVRGPVLLPTNEHFPDSVAPGPHGARTLLRRLGEYAGLGELGVRITVFDQPEHVEFDHRGIGHGGAGAGAWFAGIHGQTCEYGVERRELGDPEELIGTLGHEVAHAFREHHALAVVSRDIEERLTDLTAVYLGFGVFLLNSSQTFKTGGYSPSGDRLLYERKTRGYLSPPEIALLLSAQATARATAEAERLAIGRALAPNHAKLFDDACRLFAEEASALRRRLGVPDPVSWPRSATTAIVSPLAPDDPASDDLVVFETAQAPAPSALRLRRSRGPFFAVLGAGAPIVFAATGLIEGAVLLGFVAGGALAGLVVGRAFHDDRCSACGARLPARAERCVSCGVTLSGAVSSDEERLAAEDAAQSPEPEYDYFADPAISEGAKAEARILGAIFTEWIFRRDLVSQSFRDASPARFESARRGELSTAELFELSGDEAAFVNETAAAFSEAYFEKSGAWRTDDYVLLTTANRIRDTRACYGRVQALLDRRFEEWLAARESA